jgi:hypothetical protein
MPFGMSNSSSCFQRVINIVPLKYLSPFFNIMPFSENFIKTASFQSLLTFPTSLFAASILPKYFNLSKLLQKKTIFTIALNVSKLLFKGVLAVFYDKSPAITINMVKKELTFNPTHYRRNTCYAFNSALAV